MGYAVNGCGTTQLPIYDVLPPTQTNLVLHNTNEQHSECTNTNEQHSECTVTVGEEVAEAHHIAAGVDVPARQRILSHVAMLGIWRGGAQAPAVVYQPNTFTKPCTHVSTTMQGRRRRYAPTTHAVQARRAEVSWDAKAKKKKDGVSVFARAQRVGN